MQIKALRRDMAAINEGRWVDASEVKALGDMRVKMRGSQTEAVRARLDEAARANAPSPMQEIIWTHCLIEIEGLLDGKKPVTADDLQKVWQDPALEPLGLILLECLSVVDATREAKEAKAVKN